MVKIVNYEKLLETAIADKKIETNTEDEEFLLTQDEYEELFDKGLEEIIKLSSSVGILMSNIEESAIFNNLAKHPDFEEFFLKFADTINHVIKILTATHKNDNGIENAATEKSLLFKKLNNKYNI